LQNGTLYFFSLVAIGQNGKKSDPSDPVSATPNPIIDDGTAPAISATVPRTQASGVSLNTPFQIAFSKTMDTQSLQVTAVPAITFGAFTWIFNDSIVNFQSTGPLTAGVTYQLTVSARSKAGVALGPPKSFGFSTPEPPTVVSTTPANGATASPAPASFFI